ncbi:MAG TPA: FAD-dependent monooxygenase [Streptosporangiaceae bacterium]|jgi:2-polyprenyl-6-methoxyphenol hydroxylase-like FAD-dependent oxidoreductase|nr:FAD-dependent monooxygenase [Streptosporangiaceae bacterium]
MRLQKSYDVIVSGAGPIGLLLAGELRRGGVSVAVVERLAEPSRQIKAGSVGPQSAELFDQRGLLDAFPPLDMSIFGRPGDAGPARPTGHFAGLWVLRGAPDIRTLPILAQQAEVEAVLERYATDLGAVIAREHEVTGVSDAGDEVRVGVTSGDGATEITARYVVGCDGGRSLVRRAGGFAFPGTEPTITGRQALVEIADPNPLSKGWHRTGHGMIAFGPGPSRVLTVEFDGPPEDRDAPVTAAEVQASLRRVSGTGVTVTALHAGTRWTDNTRQAEAYQRGRLLLAGDAAHVHPPFGGQGLNLGFMDAANLGWKLAATLAGTAPPGLLDSYTVERHPAAAAALANTRAQIALMRPDPQVSALRELFVELMAFDDANQHVSRLMTGVDQPYPAGSDYPEAGRMAADRLVDLPAGRGGGSSRLYELLREPGGLLVDGSAGQDWSAAAAGYRGRVRVVAGTPGTESLLVRPDGIVAWGAAKDATAGGEAAQQLGAALARWFGHPATRPRPASMSKIG